MTQHEQETLRRSAISLDSVSSAKKWRSYNPRKCIYCKRSNKKSPEEGGCYC